MHSPRAGHVDAATSQSSLTGSMGGDCRGQNFFDIDSGLLDLLAISISPTLLNKVTPALRRLGGLAGGRLDELAFLADLNPPRLHARNRLGEDADWIEYHAAYRELERIAYGEFGIHAIGRRGGLLGSDEPLPLLLKYVCQYLFVQAEFGLMCPVAMTDSCAHVIAKHGSEQVRDLFLDGLISTDPARLLKGAQMMTERQAGSDVGAITTNARPEGARWRLSGEKWFCSAADADLTMVLARSDPLSRGTQGLSLFAVPRVLPDGSRNTYFVRRLKSKLGTRSMPTGEIEFIGAVGYLVGEAGKGLKIILDQVNMSRLSHGVRAAAMMRRCLNEALTAAGSRRAFGKRIIEMPLVQPQLLDIRLAAEQALSMFFAAAVSLDAAASGDARAASLVRVLTPLIKLGACRDNVEVATAAMELRGGNGFIADYVNERLVRDAHTGLLWEGTSNVIALDLVTRAVGKDAAHLALTAWLGEELKFASAKHPQFETFSLARARLLDLGERLEGIAARPGHCGAVEAGLAFYRAVSASLLAIEGARTLTAKNDGRRLLLARWVLERAVDTPTSFAARQSVSASLTAAISGAPLARVELEGMGL